MFIEQPPWFYRALFPGVTWRKRGDGKCVYLTFDDGPIPEVTPWVLTLLDRYRIPATFFMVGDNVRKHPEVFREVVAQGHRIGNHTFNHIQGIRYSTADYLANVEKAAQWIPSDLFRPPHGHLLPGQTRALCERYQVIMWDVVTRDYNARLSAERVFWNVRHYVRNGSIVVFHDSLKAEKNLRGALPRSIEWLLEQGFQFKTL
ncbi:MAG: polysaccharide deacetylase family protein [Parabacteroides sp.]